MSDNKYKASSTVPSNRTEKLLRDTELSKGSKASSNEASDTKSASEISELQLPSMERLGAFPVLKNIRKGLPLPKHVAMDHLICLKEFEVVYIGWAGMHVSDEAGQKALTKALAEKRCIPVFIDEEIFHQYYNGYGNNTLWPLFHYLGILQEDGPATTRSYQSQFDAYKEANRIFADVVIKHYKEDDVVWCHDYHLMFLPKYLKELNSQVVENHFAKGPCRETRQVYEELANDEFGQRQNKARRYTVMKFDQ